MGKKGLSLIIIILVIVFVGLVVVATRGYSKLNIIPAESIGIDSETNENGERTETQIKADIETVETEQSESKDENLFEMDVSKDETQSNQETLAKEDRDKIDGVIDIPTTEEKKEESFEAPSEEETVDITYPENWTPIN